MFFQDFIDAQDGLLHIISYDCSLDANIDLVVPVISLFDCLREPTHIKIISSLLS